MGRVVSRPSSPASSALSARPALEPPPRELENEIERPVALPGDGEPIETPHLLTKSEPVGSARRRPARDADLPEHRVRLLQAAAEVTREVHEQHGEGLR